MATTVASEGANDTSMGTGAFRAQALTLALVPPSVVALGFFAYCALARLGARVPLLGGGHGAGASAQAVVAPDLVDLISEALLAGTAALTLGIAAALWLAKRLLHAAQALASERDRADADAQGRSELMARVSHEIRTPLDGIIGYTRLLERTALDPQQRGYVSTIRNSGATLLTQVNDLLDFAQAEKDLLRLERVELDVRGCVEEALDLFAPLAYHKGLELAYLCAPEVPETIQGDPMRLFQVLVNLVSNAVKFTRRGEVTVEVRPLQEANGPIVRIAVSDTGSGISRADQARLFQPFARASEPGPRRFGGSGLGLVITRTLVERMGGRIHLRSARGQGTTVSFTVPLEGSSERGPPTEGDRHLEGLTAVLYERHAATRQSVRQMLRGWGIEATDTGDPATLRQVLGGRRAHGVVILGLAAGSDLSPELANAFAPAARGALQQPVVILSGGEATAPRLPVDPSRVRVVPKPVRRERLRQALLSLLDGATPTATRPAERSDDGAGRLPAGCRILVAEDNAVSRQLVATLLEARGASVTLAQDGREAWEHLLAGPFDLVLMDLHMPELDGTQVTAWLRALEAGVRHTPIVALTADAFDDTRRYVLEAGLDDYLVKPVEEPALFAVVSRRLADRPGGGAAPGADRKAGSPIQAPAIDREAALRAAAGREDLANELLGMLVGDLREQQERIASALADGDLTALAETAHSLAGGAAYCGARALHHVARALQRAAQAHDSQDVARHALALEVEAERLTRAAAAYLERSDAVRATGPAAGRERE